MKHEQPEVIREDFNYADYRNYMDSITVGARKTGLLDEELAQEAVMDRRTICMEFNGTQVPVFVPLEYVAGFDFERSRLIAEKNRTDGRIGGSHPEIYYFSAPNSSSSDVIAGISRATETLVSRTRNASIFYDFSEEDMTTEDVLAHSIAACGALGRVVKLELEDAEYKPYTDQEPGEASISFYVFDITNAHNLISTISIREAITRLRETGELDENIMVLTGNELAEKPELLEQMWQIFRRRFQDLGKNHPVSMEDSREEVVGQLCDPGAVSFIYLVNREAACFSYLLQNPEECYWLNQGFIQEKVIDDRKSFAYFPGIVADSDKGSHLSLPVFRAIIDTLHATGEDFRIAFENTNLSELYIPKLTYAAVDASRDKFIPSQPIKIDNQVYRLLELS